jgi:hypothetical protein
MKYSMLLPKRCKLPWPRAWRSFRRALWLAWRTACGGGVKWRNEFVVCVSLLLFSMSASKSQNQRPVLRRVNVTRGCGWRVISSAEMQYRMAAYRERNRFNIGDGHALAVTSQKR